MPDDCLVILAMLEFLEKEGAASGLPQCWDTHLSSWWWVSRARISKNSTRLPEQWTGSGRRVLGRN
ncbi:hypothetical protein MES4922_30490 [Mesorhizobium ventifaucium]|uniref:Uncharacterized protein n=1 Tax=Mesorhizobium ventifaucium TaxID=666020 RepID=A0ABM9DZ94_9HYPH|nr:hypothetical protein MES4922_30490 [Mesorhizobium ventifaucium]